MGAYARLYRAPSMKTLRSLYWLDNSKRQEIRELLHGEIDTYTYESVITWVGQCYHEPDLIERIMCAMNEILNTHGVEAIWHKRELKATYCNTGESFAATIVYRYDPDSFQVTSWGDLIEKYNWNGVQS